MANGHGGARPSAGRKPNAAKELEAKTITEAAEVGDPAYALGLFVRTMRDDTKNLNLRLDCAKEVMDRVWGKPTQKNEDKHSGTMTIRVVYDDKPGS